MKYNIKNRPKYKAFDEDERVTIRSLYKELEGWFEGFEKELREAIESYERGLSPKHDVCCVFCLEKGEIMKIKELLGE